MAQPMRTVVVLILNASPHYYHATIMKKEFRKCHINLLQ